MVMPPRLRRGVLIAHIATSVGWLGAVAGYLALDVAATTSDDPETTRAAYVAMDLMVRNIIVPLAFAAVVIGIVNALGTAWGLARHYWVLIKLGLTLVATAVLLIESRTVADLADLAAGGADPRGLDGTLFHSVGGLVVLLLVTAISVLKPRGVTRYGWRKQREQRIAGARVRTPQRDAVARTPD